MKFPMRIQSQCALQDETLGDADKCGAVCCAGVGHAVRDPVGSETALIMEFSV